jgi:hypothetical protein
MTPARIVGSKFAILLISTSFKLNAASIYAFYAPRWRDAPAGEPLAVSMFQFEVTAWIEDGLQSPCLDPGLGIDRADCAGLLLLKLPCGPTFTPATIGGASLVFLGGAYIAVALASRRSRPG